MKIENYQDLTIDILNEIRESCRKSELSFIQKYTEKENATIEEECEFLAMALKYLRGNACNKTHFDALFSGIKRRYTFVKDITQEGIFKSAAIEMLATIPDDWIKDKE